MDTHNRTVTPSDHLSTVQELLAKLDEMKTGKVGARQRLEFLLEKGPEVVAGFDYNDAFDLSRQAHTERVRKLADLRGAVDVVTARWHDSPLEDDVRQAGGRLIEHLSEFVRQAHDKEARFEVETLASLWEDAPDVFPAFGLPTPSYYPKTASSDDIRTNSHAGRLEEVCDRLTEEVVEENLEKLELPSEEEQAKELKKLWPEAKEGIDRQFKEAASRDDQAGAPALEKKEMPVHEEYVKKYDLVVDASKERTVDEGRHVVGKVDLTRKKAEPLEQPEEDPEESLEPEMDMLDIRSWTQAINETLASNWKFDRQLRGRVGDRGRMGVTLIWTRHDSEIRRDVERLASDEVLVRMTPPRSSKHPLEEEEGMYRTYAKEMKESELAVLHKEPSEFVKFILA